MLHPRTCLAALLGLGMTIFGAVAAQADEHGIQHLQSDAAVEEVAERLRGALEERGLNLFAEIDHAGNAEGVGLALPPTMTFIFGNPKAGTPLMQCQGSVALDLPQKMVVRQEGEGSLIEWNAPDYLAERHGLGGCDLPLDKIEGVLEAVARDAAGGS